MTKTPSHLDQFLRAIHRRMALVRGVERVGICLLGGCIAAVILLPILIWRDEPTGMLFLGILGLSLLAGMIAAAIAWPTLLAAAGEADRQLRSSDLLTTAWLLRQGGLSDAEPFHAAVIASADACCARANPSAVVFNRLGRRGWGGIAMAMLLAGAMGLLGNDARPAQADGALPQTSTSWMDRQNTLPMAMDNTTRPPHRPDFRRPDPGRGGDNTDPLRTAVENPDRVTTANGNTAGNASNTGQSESATGGGSAKSGSIPEANPANPKPISTGNARGTSDQTSSGGMGTASTGNHGNASTTGGAATRIAAIPPWRSSTWSADQQAAQEAVRSGKIPDTYRPLVRDYFSNP